jgi:hypothetical protein
VLAVHEIKRSRQKFLVYRLHALNRERAGIFDLAVGIGVNYSTRPEVLFELGIFRVVGILRLFLRVEMIEVAEELVEAVVGGKKLVLITKMVLAELPGRITGQLARTCGTLRTFVGLTPTSSLSRSEQICVPT